MKKNNYFANFEKILEDCQTYQVIKIKILSYIKTRNLSSQIDADSFAEETYNTILEKLNDHPEYFFEDCEYLNSKAKTITSNTMIDYLKKIGLYVNKRQCGTCIYITQSSPFKCNLKTYTEMIETEICDNTKITIKSQTKVQNSNFNNPIKKTQKVCSGYKAHKKKQIEYFDINDYKFTKIPDENLEESLKRERNLVEAQNIILYFFQKMQIKLVNEKHSASKNKFKKSFMYSIRWSPKTGQCAKL